ncbi:uncharacterized protein (DUF2336 family) [Kaistia hirudinis]|uniref:Uncharacterized protein (DUF2336 family) n=1 Tax=Kaistia hirudinis TaxID=1293440 RepID=A0A840ATQ8_9HYPH|nr:DUF2336 domain-containing protein [Kaistia hirudinis]MBB3932944.1 uncharacterized protein (DUF2336 family) [Kaistia hirudinis]MBN9019493.1 DUF2336 domain-containing protein [Hyphomicrobiales bacterium]
MFDQLTRLAQDRSPLGRAELLATITDLFASAGHCVDGGIAALYGDIVRRLLPTIPYHEQSEFAARLAELPTAPHDVVMGLARDEIALAEPVLRYSPVLAEEDLVMLARELPREHLFCLASRQPLGEAVTDILVARGDSLLSRVVTSNAQARLSAAGLARLVSDASADAALGETLARRCRDEGDTHNVVPFRQRAEGEGRQGGAPEGGGVVLQFVDRQGPAPNSALASVIDAVAADKRMLEVAMLLAGHAGLPVELVSRLIARTDPTLLAVLCKAAGVSGETFQRLVAIRAERCGRPQTQNAELARLYERLSASEALRALDMVRDRHVGGARPA